MAGSPPDIEALTIDDLKGLVARPLEDGVALKAENAALREEIARLKGLEGPPQSPAPQRRWRFLLDPRRDEGADAKADRVLQAIEPILAGKWKGGRRCRKMIHGVSAFRRSRAAFLNVLQSGAHK